MRILVTTNAAIGHFLPMAPTVAALVAAGHEVRVACPEAFVPFVERCGFTALGCEETPVEAGVPPAPPADDRAGRLRWAIVHSWPADGRAWVEPLLTAVAGWRPEIVLVEPVEHAGRIAAAALGVPHVVHGWGFTLPAGTDELAARGLADLYRRVGAEPVRPRLVADLGPGRLQSAGAEKAVRFAYVPWPTAGESLPPRTHHRRVLVTLGTYPNPRAAVLIRQVAQAALRDRVEVVVVLGNADRGAATSGLPNVVTVTWVDMRAAIRTSDVVVHHGGAGTSWTTLVEGRPAVVLPQGDDQFANAERLAVTGAALVVDGPDDVGPAVEAAFTDARLARAARRIARENAGLPSPDVLAAEVGALAVVGPDG